MGDFSARPFEVSRCVQRDRINFSPPGENFLVPLNCFVLVPVLVTRSPLNMKAFRSFLSLCCGGLFIIAEAATPFASAADATPLHLGVAVRDVTPQGPIWLAGYAARKKPADQVDPPLL